MSAATQSRFAEALFDQQGAMPSGLVSRASSTPTGRFAIYRNNVVSGLTRALAHRYPATEKIVGSDFFAAMARAFIGRHPPTSPVLLDYGQRFAEFAEGFEPLGELVYLPDVIRLEEARARAYHAADATSLAAREIAGVSPECLGDLVLGMHPSAAILRSHHPIVTIWAMNSGEAELGPIEDWTGEEALVVRPRQVVHIHRLPAGGVAFLGSLAAGAPLGRAVEAAMADTAKFDLTANLAGAMGAGAFTGFHLAS
jgi:hypothetical protein